MTEIKEYKQITTIELFDWEIQTEATLTQLESQLQKSRFISIGGELIATHQIKRCYVKEVSDWENFILSQKKDIRDRLYQEVKRREKEGQRISIEILQNVIERL